MFDLLRNADVRTTLILDAAVGYLMESVDMVVIGAEGVMETGGVINKIGTLGMAICAKAMNKPVYVMAESIKFVKEYPLNQSDIPLEFKVFFPVAEVFHSGLDCAGDFYELSDMRTGGAHSPA
ncbi:Translation initiation factor eIF-2B subunit alpha [Toxocara canis]|nr:Translation initiation factor eIF-2B subunit alpha [Toxocara canis]